MTQLETHTDRFVCVFQFNYPPTFLSLYDIFTIIKFSPPAPHGCCRLPDNNTPTTQAARCQRHAAVSSQFLFSSASAPSNTSKRDLKRFIYASFVCFFNNTLMICQLDDVFC